MPIGSTMTSGIGGQYILDLLYDAIEIGADAVEFVDENDPRNLGIVGIAPVGLGLRFDAARAAEYADAAVEHLQRAIDLNREVHVSRGVDDVQAMLVPLATGRSRLNRNAALLFLFHEVRRGFTVVHLTGAVNLTRQLQDALGRCGLAGVNMGEYADVPIHTQVFHRYSSVNFRNWRRCGATDTARTAFGRG